MVPQLWYATMPFLTKIYFSLAIATTLLVRFYSPTISYAYLDWNLVLAGGEVWRVATNFFVFGSLFMSAYQIGMLGHYFRCIELQYYRSHRDAFSFFLLLSFGAFVTLATSYFIWPDLRFGGPVLLFFVMTLYSLRDSTAPSGFFGLTFQRKFLPFAHLFLLYVFQTNYTLSAAGILLGYITSYSMEFLNDKTGLRIPAALYTVGEKLKLGEAAKVWQVNREAGVRLGGAETSRWGS